MLGILSLESKQNWPQMVSTLVHVYNCTKSNGMSFSLYYLMNGRHSLLPIDVEFNVKTPGLSALSTHKYLDKLWNRLQWAYQRAGEVNDKGERLVQNQFDKKVRSSALEPGT